MYALNKASVVGQCCGTGLWGNAVRQCSGAVLKASAVGQCCGPVQEGSAMGQCRKTVLWGSAVRQCSGHGNVLRVVAFVRTPRLIYRRHDSDISKIEVLVHNERIVPN